MTMSATSIKAEAANTESSNIAPYQVITMLLDGVLERIDKAILCLDEGYVEEAAVLV